MELSLPNGLHVVSVVQAAANDGPSISIRRRPTHFKPLDELIELGTLRAELGAKLREALRERRQLWFVGPPGGELAELLSAALQACPKDERVALFERAPEIALGDRSAVCLRLGSVPLEILLERVRHFRPDRLVVHEPREAELPLVLGSLAAHHDGSLVSFEHRSAKEALIAFERAAGADVVLRAVSAIVELRRGPAGVRASGIYEPSIDGSGLLALRPVEAERERGRIDRPAREQG
jgi:Flp pilus assembly CpaF family ATPase